MKLKDAFEHVQLEIDAKLKEAERRREYVSERPNLAKKTKEMHLHQARWIEEEAEALKLVLELAQRYEGLQK